MTLDVELFAKVKLPRALAERGDKSGHGIARDFLASLKEHDRRMREGEVRRLREDSCSGDLALKHEADMHGWVYVELLSFGGFISLYLSCANRWGDRRMNNCWQT